MSTESKRHISDDGADTEVFEDLAERYENGDEDDKRFAEFCKLAAQSFSDDGDEVRI